MLNLTENQSIHTVFLLLSEILDAILDTFRIELTLKLYLSP